MARLSGRGWQRLRLLMVFVAATAFVFLLPARLTAPARTVFNEAIGPIQTATFQGAGDALAATGTLTDMFLERNRERALATEVARLNNEVTVLADTVARQKRELESVRKLTVVETSFRTVSAAVSAYDASAMRRSISVRAGTRDGVGPGMAVTAHGALVGVVTEAGPRQCRVRLITDAASALPCRSAVRESDVFILQGTGEPTCAVDWVDRNKFLEVGDVLVASARQQGADSLLRLPDGLPIATVRTIERDSLRPLFLAVQAEPRVKLDRLETVEVLVPE
jgi:rod shape-determining protein MreC